jgi:hypothetical protein
MLDRAHKEHVGQPNLARSASGNRRWIPFLHGTQNCIGQHLAMVRSRLSCDRAVVALRVLIFSVLARKFWMLFPAARCVHPRNTAAGGAAALAHCSTRKALNTAGKSLNLETSCL